MFKKAKVLYYIEKIDSTVIKEIYNLIDELKSEEKTTIIPDLKSYNENNSSDFVNLNNFLLPGTIIAQNYQFDDNFCFFCLPANSLHFSTPIKPGELIWYFEDNEINEISKSILDNYPLLGIKYYWTSRIIGSRVSEDLNYSLKENDYLITKINYTKNNLLYDEDNTRVLDKKSNKQKQKDIINKILLPDFEIPSLLKEIKNENQLISSGILYNNNKNYNFIPTAVPRYFPKSHELSLQGSNNSLINLTVNETSNRSQIDFVVGRHFAKDFRPFVLKDDFLFINNVEIDNRTFETEEINSITIDLRKGYNIITNSYGDETLFKNPDYYLGEDLIDDSNEESDINYIYDASRILINESSDVSIYYKSNSEINTNLINKHDFVVESSNLLDINDIQSITEHNKKVNNNTENVFTYNERINEDFINNEFLPNIVLKTNNIRLISRKTLKNEINEVYDINSLNSGNLMLIKEGNRYLDDSFINLEKNGDILIDGTTLYLGNFNKEILRQNIKNEDEILQLKSAIENKIDINDINSVAIPDDFFNLTKDEADKMIGNGLGVVLGYNAEYSEPLVLGNSLIVLLKTLIDTNIMLVDEVKKLSDDLQKHVHIGVIPGGGISGIIQNPSPYIEYSTSGSSNLNSDFEEIKNNLKYILSKFAKTS